MLGKYLKAEVLEQKKKEFEDHFDREIAKAAGVAGLNSYSI